MISDGRRVSLFSQRVITYVDRHHSTIIDHRAKVDPLGCIRERVGQTTVLIRQMAVILIQVVLRGLVNHRVLPRARVDSSVSRVSTRRGVEPR